MMCVWQQKAQKLVNDGNFDFKKAKAAFKDGRGIGQVGRPSDAGAPAVEAWKGQTARGMAELTNAIRNFSLNIPASAFPVMFHEECLHGHAAHNAQFSAAHRPRRDLQSRSRRKALHHDRGRNPRAQGASGAHSGRGRSARSPLGSGGRNPSAKTRISSRNWGWPPCAVSKVTPVSRVRNVSSRP